MEATFPAAGTDEEIIAYLKTEMGKKGIAASQLWQTSNADRSESLGVNELERGLLQLGMRLSPEQSRRIFEVFDVAHRDDDRITWREFDLTLEHGPDGARALIAEAAAAEAEAASAEAARAAAARRTKAQATRGPRAPPLHDHSRPIMPVGTAEECVAWLRAHLERRRISTESLFRRMDGDRSNSVGVNELQEGLKTAGVFVNRGEALRMMKAVDPDGDGVLRLQELRDVLEHGLDRARELAAGRARSRARRDAKKRARERARRGPVVPADAIPKGLDGAGTRAWLCAQLRARRMDPATL